MVNVLYFAWLRERTGCAGEALGLPPGVRTIAGLISILAERHPAAFARPGLVRAAVNQEFADAETEIGPGDEIAFFPPVTGG